MRVTSGISVLVVLCFTCHLALAKQVAPSLSSSQLIEPLLRGFDARFAQVKTQIHTIKGSWSVEDKEPYDMARIARDPSVSLDYNRLRLVTIQLNVESAIAGDRWRSLSTTLSPPDRQEVRFDSWDGATQWGCNKDSLVAPWRIREAHQTEPAWPSSSFFEYTDLGYAAAMASEIRRATNRTARKEQLGGHTVYVLSYTLPGGPPKGTRTLWIRPDYGYAVVRDEVCYDAPKNSQEPWVHSRNTKVYGQFVSLAKGVWFPSTLSSLRELELPGGKWIMIRSRKARATLLKANVTIPTAEFQPPRQAPRTGVASPARKSR